MFWSNKPKRIFLDYASTTPVAKEVADKMRETEQGAWANQSALYGEALIAKEVMQKERKSIARILNCQKTDIVFTSGGTEGNNLAILGVFEACRTRDFTPHIVTTVIEHSAILEVCKEIERRGGEVTYLKVSPEGLVSPKDIHGALKENTVLVTVAYANNEIGTIQPIKDIGRAIKDWRQKKTEHQNGAWPYFHTDACQAGQYLSLDVLKLGVDIMTLDGIKIYGPRGMGILYLRHGVNVTPVIFGGGQEKGLRSGTENVPGIVGFAKALEIADSLREKESERLTALRDYATDSIIKNFPKAVLNGSKESRLPNNINVCFRGLHAEFAVISLDMAGISVSYSSSCRTLKEDPSSYVVSALDMGDCSTSSLRFTLGRESTKKDIDDLLNALQKIVLQ